MLIPEEHHAGRPQWALIREVHHLLKISFIYF